MASHPRPYYYLENFAYALDSLVRRYADLLSLEERAFIETFRALPQQVSGLLVRMIGRRGALFRSSRLRYEEIPEIHAAADTLAEAGWIELHPRLTCAELFTLLTKPELCAVFNVPGAWKAHRKSELLAYHEALPSSTPRTLTDWWPGCSDRVYRVLISPLCERLRIVFFGNFRQEWSEFVLAELGIFQYERVPIDAMARAFRSRAEIDQFDALFRCRQLMEKGAEVPEVLAALPAPLPDCSWLEARRARLLFRIGQQCERLGDHARALEVYGECAHPEARARRIRVLERLERATEAYALFEHARSAPTNELEAQRLGRMAARLHRKTGRCLEQRRRADLWQTFDLALPALNNGVSVERRVAEHLAAPDAPVVYVENALINTLCGLLCWEAIFAPIPGAFFHDFHAAPADLLEPHFLKRREPEFARCFARLDSAEYRECILATFEAKANRASPFVAWGLPRETLVLALECIPAQHLRALFERILADIGVNRSGLPDLIQLWPAMRRYRLIEVKGPGDRLQDNQIRWLSYCAQNEIPIAVCKVRWTALGEKAAAYEEDSCEARAAMSSP